MEQKGGRPTHKPTITNYGSYRLTGRQLSSHEVFVGLPTLTSENGECTSIQVRTGRIWRPVTPDTVGSISLRAQTPKGDFIFQRHVRVVPSDFVFEAQLGQQGESTTLYFFSKTLAFTGVRGDFTRLVTTTISDGHAHLKVRLSTQIPPELEVSLEFLVKPTTLRFGLALVRLTIPLPSLRLST